MLDPYIGDFEIIDAKRRAARNYRARKQQKGECNVCHQIFSSRTKLFAHLDTNRLHQANMHEVSYTMKCRIHLSFIASGFQWKNRSHFIPIDEKYSRCCQELYPYSAEVVPWYQKARKYTVLISEW